MVGTEYFTTIVANLAIWLANLPSSIRVHTTLLASMCRAMPFSARVLKKKTLFWRWCCGKKQIEMWFSVVCTLIDNEYASLLSSQTFFLIVYPAFWDSSVQRFFGKGSEKSSFDKRFPMKNDTQQRHFYRTMENMNRSKIVRFPANFTPEITLKVSWQQ